jgi:hypothetical protein
MRTSFTDNEDKLLVQIALQFEREGLRITWAYVARRMKTKRSANELRLRLTSLKSTYGKTISTFPRCFFSGLPSRGVLVARARPPHSPATNTRTTTPSRSHTLHHSFG